MLDGMRKASQGAVGKAVMTVVMGLIIVSFAVWGVGDMLRGFTSTTVAKVGSVSISQGAFSNAVQSETYRLQRQYRQPLTPQQARSLGVDAQVLDRMIDEAALNQSALKMGLAISNESIASAVRDDPSLKGLDGKFDHNRFDEMLRDAGMNERDFFPRSTRRLSAPAARICARGRDRGAQARSGGVAGEPERNARDRLFRCAAQRRRRCGGAGRRRAEGVF